MTGMAFLLICASWVGDSGWQSAPTTAATLPAASSVPVQPRTVQPQAVQPAAVQAAVATAPWVSSPGLSGAGVPATTVLDPAALERAEQSVRQGIDRFSDAARELGVSGVPALPDGSAVSVWREIEGALMQPAQRPVSAVPADSRSFGAAGHLRVANYADQPPQPPADPYGGATMAPVNGGQPTYGTPTYAPPSYGSPSYGAPTYSPPTYGGPGSYGGATNYGNPPMNAGQASVPPSLPRDVPAERGNVRQWLDHERADGYTNVAGTNVSSQRPRVGLPPGRDAFPEEEASRGERGAASQGRWAHEREVSYEDRVAVNPRPERRYLDPPDREERVGDDRGDGRLGGSGRLRQDRDDGPLRDRANDRGDDRGEDRGDERYADDRPRRAGSRVIPASVEQEIVASATERKPWWPLMLTLLGLFASGGFNVYLGWIAWDLYTRHLDMLEDVRELESRLEKQQAALDAGSMTSGRSSRATAMAG